MRTRSWMLNPLIALCAPRAAVFAPLIRSTTPHIRVAVLAAILSVLSPILAFADVIYDFEDRTFQGWEVQGDVSIARMFGVFQPDTHYAVFGIDRASMRITIDLTTVDGLLLDAFSPYTSALDTFVYVIARPGNSPPFDFVGTPVPIGPTANPGQLFISLNHLTGVHEITIAWDGATSIPPDPEPTIYFPGFLDRITFTTLPEPPGVALLALLVARVACLRGRRKQRRIVCTD